MLATTAIDMIQGQKFWPVLSTALAFTTITGECFGANLLSPCLSLCFAFCATLYLPALFGMSAIPFPGVISRLGTGVVSISLLFIYVVAVGINIALSIATLLRQSKHFFDRQFIGNYFLPACFFQPSSARFAFRSSFAGIASQHEFFSWLEFFADAASSLVHRFFSLHKYASIARRINSATVSPLFADNTASCCLWASVR